MTDWLDLLDRNIRRGGVLPRVPWLRTLLRKPYHALLRRSKTGFALSIGSAMPVRLPGEFCASELEIYETESARAISEWARTHPGGLFVDIGCSYGYFSCGVLFSNPHTTVLAIDADLPSLAITRYVCKYAPDVSRRLELVHALIAPSSSGRCAPAELRLATEQCLDDPGLKADPRKTNYVNLDTSIDENRLPRVSLDDLLAQRLGKLGTPCMIKCDVEGAELQVLQGATAVLREHRPTVLLSVHPPYLPRFGSSVPDIQNLLDRAGYASQVIAVDHEEHWLCRPL